MIKYILSFLFLFVITTSFSQSMIKNINETPASEIALKSTELMDEKLNLSVEQNDLVYKIYEENWIVKKDMIANGSFFSIRGKIKEQNKIQNNSFKDVLTNEQYQLYEDKAFDEIKSSIKAWLNNKE